MSEGRPRWAWLGCWLLAVGLTFQAGAAISLASDGPVLTSQTWLDGQKRRSAGPWKSPCHVSHRNIQLEAADVTTLVLCVPPRSLLTPTPPDPRTEAVPCRLGMVEVSRALEKLCREKEEGQDGPCENEGWFYYCLANVSWNRW